MSVRLMVIAATGAALLAGGCASSKSGTTTPTSGSQAAPGTVALAKSGSHTIFTSSGFSLYYFDPDSPTTIACTGQCATIWPPIAGPVTAGAGLPASQFGTITRPDGTKQVTFGGHPLYRYTGDSAPGDTKGDGFQGKWHLVGLDDASTAGAGSSAGSTPAATTPAAATSSASTGSSGYGY